MSPEFFVLTFTHMSIARGSSLAKALKFVFLTFLYAFIALTILSLVLENTGIARANNSSPKNMEFESPAGGKVYKFSDVHGVDEAKDVGLSILRRNFRADGLMLR